MVKEFSLDSRGKSRTRAGVFRIKTASTTSFTARLTKGDWHEEWANEGLISETIKNKAVKVMVSLRLGDAVYEAEQDLTYHAKEGRSGKAQ